MSLEVAAYMYIEGPRTDASRADLMYNRQAYKYVCLIAMRNDASRNSVGRSTLLVYHMYDSSFTNLNNGKAPTPPPLPKRSQSN